MHLFSKSKLIYTLQSVLHVFISHLPLLSWKIPTLLHFWRATLELWPHLDGEHLWSANNYPISAKRGCSCSPRAALIPAHTSRTTASPPTNTPHPSRQLWFLPAPTSEAGEYLGGVVALWRGGGEGVMGINGVLLVDKAQTKRAFSGWDRRASPHTPGWPGES